MANRPRDVRAEVVEAKFRLLDSEKVRCVERVVAEVIVYFPVNLIASGFCHDADDGSRSATILRLVVAGLNLELRNRFQATGKQTGSALVPIGHVRLVYARGIDTIDRKLVMHRVKAVEAEIRDVVAARHRSRRQQAEPCIVAAIDRQIGELPRVHRVAQGRGGRIDGESLRCDLDTLTHTSCRQRKVKPQWSIHAYRNIVLNFLRETWSSPP